MKRKLTWLFWLKMAAVAAVVIWACFFTVR